MSGPLKPPTWRWRRRNAVAPLEITPVDKIAQAYVPSLDRLAVEARSVAVPAGIALTLIIGALLATVAALTLTGFAVERSAVLDDLDSVSQELTVREAQACRDRRQDLEDARTRHIDETGGRPTDIDDLSPGADDFVLDRNGHPVPAPGSACESIGATSTSSAQAVEDRAAAAWAEVAASLGVALIWASVLALWIGAGAVSWWLAAAYRCLPRAARGVTPRRAYTLVRTMAGTTLAFYVAAFLVDRHVADQEPLTGALIVLVVVTACLAFLVRALLVVIDMIGDVTFEFCGRHYGTSRAMRLSVLGLVLVPGARFGLGVLAGAASYGSVLQDAISVGVLLVYLVALILPVVFVVCLVVSIVLANTGIGGRLREGAEELQAAEARERERARLAASAQPVGV
ncbi:MAG TPA: hypothetical protein VK507_10595 [Iamia sp.]|nr:hypothetical protein [Iamia sp.]